MDLDNFYATLQEPYHASASIEADTGQTDGIYKPLVQDEIRLLELQPGDEHDTIECRLTVWPLKTAPAYTALSYKWGSAAGSDGHILLDGRPIAIRKNLHRFLRSARGLKQAPGALWIDALCIDQSNVTEQGQQVSQMPEVYKQAAQVTVWLGPAYGGSDAAMDALSRIRLGKVNATAIMSATSHISMGIALLCHRPYWNRLWILQELILANDAILVSGSKTVPYAFFSSLLLQVNEQWQLGQRRIRDASQYALIQRSPATNLVTLMQERREDVHLLDLLVSTSHLKCSNPLDRVYALLGIGFHRHHDFQPDYTMQLADLLGDIVKQAHAIVGPVDLETVDKQYNILTRIFDVEPFAISKITDPPRRSWISNWLQVSRPRALEELARVTNVSRSYPERCWRLPEDLTNANRSRRALILWWAIFYDHQAVQALFVAEHWMSYICEMYLGYHLQDVDVMHWVAEEAMLPANLRPVEISNDRDHALFSFMELVCYRGDIATLSRLIKLGIPVKLLLTWSLTVYVDYTIEDRMYHYGHLGCLQVLLEQGAKHVGRMRTKTYFFEVAARYGFTDLVRALLPGVKCSSLAGTSVNCALRNAVACGHEEVVTLILDDAFDGMHLYGVLEDAVGCDQMGCLSLCLSDQHGDHFDYRQRFSALEAAVIDAKYAYAEIILQAGGIRWSDDRPRKGVLLKCVGRGDTRMTELLLKHGATEIIDKHSPDTGNALDIALHHQDDDMVKLLKAYGAGDCSEMAAKDLPGECLVPGCRRTHMGRTTLGITRKEVSVVSASSPYDTRGQASSGASGVTFTEGGLASASEAAHLANRPSVFPRSASLEGLSGVHASLRTQ